MDDEEELRTLNDFINKNKGDQVRYLRLLCILAQIVYFLGLLRRRIRRQR